MNFSTNMKKFFAALLVIVMVFSMVPLGAVAASDAPIDAAILFSDLHTNKNDYKQDEIKAIMTAFKNTGMPYSSVTSCGDAFSVNEDNSSSNGPYTGYTKTLNDSIRSVFAGIPVNYVWSDHDRYAVQEDGSTLLDKTSQLVYGAGNDGVYGTADDGNYYVYSLSMGDLCSYDRYQAGFNYTPSSNNRTSKGFTSTVETAISNFQAAVAGLDQSKPLLIASHQPLFDNRNDNAWAEMWFDAINAVAEKMDVVFFYGHNHKYDSGSDYYYAKGSSMPVATQTTSSGTWNYNYEVGVGYKPSIDLKSESNTLNFTHLCAGYLEPTSTGSYSSSTTRLGTAISVVIYEDSLVIQTYDEDGLYTGKYAVNQTVTRDHADVTEPEVPDVTEPEVPETTVPEATEPEAPTVPEEPEEPTVPEEPEVTGTVWRQATSITAGQKYMLVNYGYNSDVGTFAVGSNAQAVSVTVNTDENGAYIVNDDLSLAWVSAAKNAQFTMVNAENGKYLRTAGTSYNSTSGSDISVTSSVSSSNYAFWSLETKNGSQILAVRRSTSSNYYPVRYTGSKFQSFNASQVGNLSNWLVVFVETEESLHKHSYEAVTVAATCTESGSVTTTCTGCGEQTVEVIPATGHKYTCVETAATCTENGSKVYTCANCGNTYTETIPATGHNYASQVTKPTCTEEGFTTYTCACGDSYVDDLVAALGHSYKAVTTEPTCTEEGVTVYTCACGESYSEVIPATGEHEYSAVITAPTCTEEGFTTYTCACGDSYVDDLVAALGHSYKAVTTEPTCTEEGFTVYTCACGESYSEVIPATGEHEYSAVVTAPTCTEEGFTTYTCACGDSYAEDLVAALGHSYDARTVAPTCTEEGYTVYTCHCGDSYAADRVAALGHDYQAAVTAPTCAKEGFTTYTCANCADSYVADQVAALGHDYQATVTAPTCTEEGFTTYTCHCGASFVGNYTQALGHSYTAEEANGYMVYTCANCGHSYSEKLEADVSYKKVSSLSDDSYVITLTSGNNYYALSHKDNKLSVVQVTVSDDVITSEITDDLVWTYKNGVLSYEDGNTTYYLYAQPASGWWAWFSVPTLTISTSNSTQVTFSSNKLKMGYYYLRYSNGSVSLNRSGTTAALFAETEN